MICAVIPNVGGNLIAITNPCEHTLVAHPQIELTVLDPTEMSAKRTLVGTNLEQELINPDGVRAVFLRLDK